MPGALQQQADRFKDVDLIVADQNFHLNARNPRRRLPSATHAIGNPDSIIRIAGQVKPGDGGDPLLDFRDARRYVRPYIAPSISATAKYS